MGPQPWASRGICELIHMAWSFGPQVSEAAMKVFPPGVQTLQGRYPGQYLTCKLCLVIVSSSSTVNLG